MKRKQLDFRLIKVVSVFLLLLLTGCGSSWEWKQKMVVEVETPAGLKVASSVLLMEASETSDFFSGAPWASSVLKPVGEAVVLEVVPGKYLFALLVSEKGSELYFKSANYTGFKKRGLKKPAGEKYLRKRDIYDWLEDAKAGERFELKHFPLLLTFRDLDRSTTFERVDPANLAATFGNGVKLKNIYLETTDEPVTTGRLRKTLSWYDTYDWKRIPFRSILRGMHGRGLKKLGN